MSHTVTEKTIWVTGASSGIGAAVVELLASNKNYVIATARSEERLKALHNTYPEHVRYIAADVGDEQAMSLAANKLRELTDHIDLVLVCAGTCEYEDGMRFDTAMYQRVFNVNFFGALHTVRTSLPFLRASQNRPRIVAVSSLSTMAAFPRAEAYGASKSALEYFFQALKVDLKGTGIEVSIVRPGFVDTPLTQKNDFSMPFMVSADDAAKAIVSGIAKGKLFIEFPSKMSWPLSFFGALPSLWLNYIAPKFRKTDPL